MNMKKRSIVSILLIIAMTFSLLAFTSCSGSSETEETIKVHVNIVGTDTATPLFDMEVTLTGYPSDLTAAAATKQACSIEGLTYNYDESLGAVIQIGDFINQGSAGAATSETDADGNAITAAPTAEAMTGLFWQLYINGTESSSSQLLKDGDKLNWSFVNLPITNK